MSGPGWMTPNVREPMVNELACLRAERDDLKTALQVAVDDLLKMQLARDNAREAARKMVVRIPAGLRLWLEVEYPWLEEE